MVPLPRGAGDLSRVFRPGAFVPAPDGTEVDPFLNPADDAGAGPLPTLPEGLGVAAGRIRAGVTSAIHAHPVVTQVTHVVSGRLTVRMRDPDDAEPHELVAEAGAAVVTEPGVAMQLANDADEDVHVLYITSPAYLAVRDEGRTIYDDAILLDGWSVPLSDADRAGAKARRAEILRRSTGA